MKSSKKTKEIPAELLEDFSKLSISDDKDSAKEIDFEEDSLVFLGTGSMIPLPSRTVSAILIQRKQGNILMDCGEGTYS